jgi:hypothetical protein
MQSNLYIKATQGNLKMWPMRPIVLYTFSGSLGWPLYTGLIAFKLDHIDFRNNDTITRMWKSLV